MRFLDFLLTIAALLALLVATYLFSTDPTAGIARANNTIEASDQDSKPQANIEDVTLPEKPAIDWRYIIIHHSATLNGNLKIFNNYHRNTLKLKDGIAYHFVIGNGTNSRDGELEISPRWEQQKAGPRCFNSKINKSAIRICLVGNFEKNKPTEQQIATLTRLIKHLQKKHQISTQNVLPYRAESSKTLSPGKLFPLTDVKKALCKATGE